VIFRNIKDHGDGRLMAVPPTLDAFLKAAGEKLKCKADKAYTENGEVIDSVSHIKEDEKIFISEGEGFFKTESSVGKHVRAYKIALLGAGGVGKSCISMRYVKSTFVEIYDPTIEDAFRHQTVIDGVTCILDILDTAGQEDMKMLRSQWVQDRDGFLLTFNLTDRTTFEEIAQFYNLIREVKDIEEVNLPLVIVGNKSDLVDKRQVSKQEGQNLAQKYKASYVETSAKSGENVTEAFEMLIRKFMKQEATNPTPKKKPSICRFL